MQKFKVNGRIAPDIRQREEQRGQELRGGAVHRGRAAAQRPPDGERAFAVRGFRGCPELFQCAEQAGHQPGAQRGIPVETDPEALQRGQRSQHPQPRPGVAEVDGTARIGETAAGSGDLPPVRELPDLRSEQFGRLQCGTGVGGLQRRIQRADAVGHQRRRDAADRMGFGPRHRDRAADAGRFHQKFHQRSPVFAEFQLRGPAGTGPTP